jgi:exopolysaccharide biosynthesis polyprenyl glycosylphosphotransferase
MLRQHDRKLRTLLLLTDIAVCGATFAVAIALGTAELRALPAALDGWRLLLFSIAAALALPIAIRALQPEASMRLESLAAVARRLLGAGLAASVVLAALAFALNAPLGPSALFLAVAAQVAATGALRLAILAGLRLLRRSGRNFRSVLVVGTGPRALSLTETIQRHPEWGLRVVGYMDEGDEPIAAQIPKATVYKLVDFPLVLRESVIDEVIVACPRSLLPALGPALQACSASGVPLTLMTDLFGDYLPPPRVKRFAYLEALSFAPVHHSPSQLAVKRALDVTVAALGLVVTAPILAIAALAIRLDSKGPILFRQMRCGLYGRPFLMCKLRTMVNDAEARRHELQHLNEMDGPVFKIQADPRITRVGRWLRRFSLDEIPQLWNVLVGDMSLVGPRPPLPSEVVQYETSERRRLSMRPGLTCLWQVNGRNALEFDEWVKLDLQYIDGWSLGSDMRILVLTVPTVLRGTGA